MKTIKTFLTLLIGVLGLGMYTAVTAAPITLVPSAVAEEDKVQHSNETPCIFGSPSCNDINDKNVLTPGNETDPDKLTSPDYTVGEIITSIAGDNLFDIGIDSNTSGSDSDTLTLFNIFVSDNLEWSFSGTQNISPVGNDNGNGFTDWLLSGPVDFSGFGLDELVYFELDLLATTDGQETVFLIGRGFVPPMKVPEPGTLALLGLGLAGMGFARRRRCS